MTRERDSVRAPAGPIAVRDRTRPATPGPGLVRYGRYLLIDRLGAGGMAEVFRALMIGPEHFQRPVVVKRILPHLNANPGFVKMFIDEATLCGRLSHPNIIQIYEFGKQDDQYFIAMEHVQGRSLNQVMSRLAANQEHMPVTIAAEIARQTCVGLAYAHGLTSPDGKTLGIIHRDVSPGNVMVAFAGGVKVLDFGIARVANEFRVGTTDPGQVKGKSAYLAPEQLGAGGFDARADLFSVGILLHEMLAGRRLFRAESQLATMKLIHEMPIEKPTRWNPEVPGRLEGIVMRALARQPDERYQSAEDMAAALEAFLLEERFSSQELPKFLRDLFGDESALHHLHFTREELEALLPEEETGIEARPERTMESTGSAVRDDLPGPSLLSEWPALAPGMAPLPDGRRKRLLAVGAVVLASAGALALVLSAGRSGSTTVEELAPPGPVAAPAPVPAPPVPIVVPVPAPAPAPAGEVNVSITSEPSEALVYRGEEAQPSGTTPLALKLPRGGTAVELRIAKAGYVERLIKVVPDADKPVPVTLAKTERARSHSRRDKVRNAIPIDPFAE